MEPHGDRGNNADESSSIIKWSKTFQHEIELKLDKEAK